MNKTLQMSAAALLLLMGSAASTSLELTLDNTLYARNNRIDSAAPSLTYSEGLSASLQKIGATDLSLYADVGFSNAFLDSGENNFELRTLYLDAPVLSFGYARLGRQMVSTLVNRNLYLDGISLGHEFARRMRVHAYVGEPLPSRYGETFVNRDLNLLQSGIGADLALHSTTWVGVAAGREKDSAGSEHLPIAAYVESRFNGNLGLKADAEYDLSSEELEHYGIALDGRPTAHLRWRAYLLGEARSIDSTNAYERLILGKHTDVGLQLGCTGRRHNASAYYSLRLVNNGNDHLTGASVSIRGIFLNAESGYGVSGSSLKLAAGYAYDILTTLRIGVLGTSYAFETTQNPEQKQSLTARTYLNWNIPNLGLAIAPEMQFLSNDYYSKDVRFLLSAQYSFLTFWK